MFRTIRARLGGASSATLLYVAAVAIVLSSLPGLPADDFPGGGYDANFALQLQQGYEAAVRRGDWLPGWMAAGNLDHGSPVRFFYGFLPYIISSSVAIALGLSAQSGLVLGMLLFRLAALASCYAWLRSIVCRARAAEGAALFVAVPFNFYCQTVVRFDYAETAATALLPLLFLAVERTRGNRALLLTTSLIVALLAITHLPQCMLGSGMLLLYVLMRRRLVSVAAVCGGIALGLALAAFSVVPAIYLLKAISPAAWTAGPFIDVRNFVLFTPRSFAMYRFLKLQEVTVYGSWVFGMILLGVACWHAAKSRANVRRAIFTPLAVTAAIGLLGMTFIASWPWTHIGLLKAMQFPWRLLPSTFVLIVGAISLADLPSGRRRLFITGCSLVLLASQASVILGSDTLRARLEPRFPLLHLLPLFPPLSERGASPWIDRDRDAGEYIPLWAHRAGWIEGRDLVVTFTGEHGALARTSTPSVSVHRKGNSFVLTGVRPATATVVLPVFFFPGWRATWHAHKVHVGVDGRTGYLSVTLPIGQAPVLVRRVMPTCEKVGILFTFAAALLLAYLGAGLSTCKGAARRRSF